MPRIIAPRATFRRHLRVVHFGRQDSLSQAEHLPECSLCLKTFAYTILDRTQHQIFFRSLILEFQVVSMGLHQRVGHCQRALDLRATSGIVDVKESPHAIRHGKVELIG